jgi:hypothetical protein
MFVTFLVKRRFLRHTEHSSPAHFQAAPQMIIKGKKRQIVPSVRQKLPYKGKGNVSKMIKNGLERL